MWPSGICARAGAARRMAGSAARSGTRAGRVVLMVAGSMERPRDGAASWEGKVHASPRRAARRPSAYVARHRARYAPLTRRRTDGTPRTAEGPANASQALVLRQRTWAAHCVRALVRSRHATVRYAHGTGCRRASRPVYSVLRLHHQDSGMKPASVFDPLPLAAWEPSRLYLHLVCQIVDGRASGSTRGSITGGT